MIPLVVDPEPAAREKAAALVGAGVPEPTTEPNVVAPAVVVDVAGEPLLLAARLDDDALRRFRQGALDYPMRSTARAVGIRNRSRVFGFGARAVVMKRNGCHLCAGALDAPAAHERLVSAAESLRDIFRKILPEEAARDENRTRLAVLPEWRIGDTQWTSGVLNRTSPLPYHYDRNNLEPVWSAMIVARRGVRGGYLHVPELGLVVECRDGDVVFFPGWKYVHGVTPLRRTARDGYRLTAVYYAVAGMAECLPPEEEMARARADRTRREGDLRPAAERLGKARS